MRVWRGNRHREKEQPSAGFGFSGWLKATPVATPVRRRSRSGFGTVSERGPLSRQHGGFAGFEFRGRHSILATDFVAGAALSQGQVQMSWQARHFLASGTDASQIPLARTRKAAHADSWQGQHFRKVRRRFRGRGSIFARSIIDFLAGAAFSQGQVHISWQGQHFRKVKCRFRCRRSNFAR